MDLLLVLNTTHQTLRAEKVLKGVGINHRTVMKPRSISSDCGLAIRFEEDTLEKIREAIETAGLLPAFFYRLEEKKWNSILEIDIPG